PQRARALPDVRRSAHAPRARPPRFRRPRRGGARARDREDDAAALPAGAARPRHDALHARPPRRGGARVGGRGPAGAGPPAGRARPPEGARAAAVGRGGADPDPDLAVGGDAERHPRRIRRRERPIVFLTAELPGTGGVLKADLDDFVVEELPAYGPAGS